MDEGRSLIFMTIYPESTTRPVEVLGAASAYGGPAPSAARGRRAPHIALDHDNRGCRGSGAFAQDDGSPRWLERASITRAKQPDWVTPLVTASANLEEAVMMTSREDSDQWNPTGYRRQQPRHPVRSVWGASDHVRDDPV